jgi:hypothetical protein
MVYSCANRRIARDLQACNIVQKFGLREQLKSRRGSYQLAAAEAPVLGAEAECRGFFPC